jgi:ribonuclease VapC
MSASMHASAPQTVLDSSCLLASVFQEPGSEKVRALLAGAMMTAVNWSEFVQKAAQYGVNTMGMRSDVEGAGLRIMPVTADLAEAAAALWPIGKKAGLSLGDRMCLALAHQYGATAYTTDVAWTACAFDFPVVCIRPPRPSSAVHEAIAQGLQT